MNGDQLFFLKKNIDGDIKFSFSPPRFNYVAPKFLENSTKWNPFLRGRDWQLIIENVCTFHVQKL